MRKGMCWRGLEIDSLRDIAVNKIYTLATIPRTRDYVDVYYILTETRMSLTRLLTDAEKKIRRKERSPPVYKKLSESRGIQGSADYAQAL